MAVLRSIPNEFFTMIHGNYSLTSLILPTDCPPPQHAHTIQSQPNTYQLCYSKRIL